MSTKRANPRLRQWASIGAVQIWAGARRDGSVALEARLPETATAIPEKTAAAKALKKRMADLIAG